MPGRDQGPVRHGRRSEPRRERHRHHGSRRHRGAPGATAAAARRAAPRACSTSRTPPSARISASTRPRSRKRNTCSFLVSIGNDVPEQIPACAGNVSFTHTPDGTCPTFNESNELPVWCIDWCDARAYCEWAGKRLCKKIDGDPLDFDDDPVLGEWHFACSGGLQTLYPYGDDPDDTACHIDDMINKEPVASFPGCEGGYPGLFDMQGNVHEWVDACESDEPTAQCRVRGGGTYGAAVQWSCARVEAQMGFDRLDNNSRTVGARCCADPG